MNRPSVPSGSSRGHGRGPVHRRRGRTRWLLVTPIVGLALIVTGVILLEQAGPIRPNESLVIEDLPPFALEEAYSCLRQADDPRTAELRDRFPAGGRIASAQIFQCPAAFDDRPVLYIGEVVGEILRRRGGAWVQVNDDAYALESGPLVGHGERTGFNSGLAVWLPDGLHEQIGTVGRSEQRGDIVRVRGTLLRTDPDDGGGITIRAEELEVVAQGVRVEDPLHVPQLVIALILAGLTLATVVWSRGGLRRL